ncbi:aminotransferase class III-fold pyridoxal phosphate-dependent enzyme [Cellulomonas sp. PhB143]|uniref:aminotransferase class III-fold pyridoxal phosphate-dependent enzyme n=1 Tax=Cellulomonas sp. PhB143 TaxID=2485186 RepID=UPI000F47022A|nr:aminotransferase class III-fold pyridoxal phosphate-dependent enzyme [Cellulomonas sp. PhB143]ROS76628.1 adenosylmethionine-8-amino-7-oxononanoate aminotransferase [Cellulomonas sp. PhB143]
MAQPAALATMYSGRGAELYDRVVQSDRSELREILRTVRRGQDRVLELACGSGRITRPLLAVSASVVAVDNSAALLSLLDERAGGDERLTTVCADLRDWAPGETFDKVVLGTTSISLFDAAERAALFARVRRWLEPGGQFLVTLRVPPTADEAGAYHQVFEDLGLREDFDAAAGMLTSTLIELRDGRPVGEHAVATNLLRHETLLGELGDAGFDVMDELEIDPRTRDARIGDHRLVVAAPRPARGRSPYFEFFLPPRQWGEAEAVGARGTTVDFADGTSAICGISGIWNASLGYGNAAVAEAIDRANRAASALPIFRRGSSYAREAAERLLDLAGTERYASVFYSTSGSAALDAVVKLSRQVAKHERGLRARRVVSLVGSYHGITSSSMALSGAYLFQDVYDVDERLHIKVPHDDPQALEIVMRRFGPEIAAVVVEPVLGSGALPLSDEMLERLFAFRRQHRFLLVADEVATGFYRTGDRFSSGTWAQAADMMVLSKALTNGTCAASAVLVSDRILGVLATHDEIFWHGETQAGSPQSCAAMLATIDEFERLDVASTVRDLAVRLEAGVGEIAAASPRLSASGRGAMWAVHIDGPDGRPVSSDDVYQLVRACRRDGVIVQPSPSAIQIMPAFTMEQSTVDDLLARVDGTIGELLAATS